MRVGFDALSVRRGLTGGGETYIVRLLEALAGLDHPHEVVVFALEGLRERLPRDRRMTLVEPFPPAAPLAVARRILWEQLRLPFEVRRRQIDAMVFLGNMMSFRCPVPSLLTVHDLVSYYYAERFPDRLGVVRGSLLPRLVAMSARRATRILASSTHTRHELERRLGIPPERIAVCPLGVSPAPPAVEPAALARAKALGPFVLFVGTRDSHKNLSTLLDAMVLLRGGVEGGAAERGSTTSPAAIDARTPAGARAHRLVLAGMPGTASRELDLRVKAMGQEVVLDLGIVDDALLGALYACASAFVFPSLYEGFGLPVLEAMAASVPVIAARAGPLPEVAGDAALLFDPLDPRDLARAMARVLGDGTLARDLRARGRERAAPDGPFAWTRTARIVLAEIERLLAVQDTAP